MIFVLGLAPLLVSTPGVSLPPGTPSACVDAPIGFTAGTCKAWLSRMDGADANVNAVRLSPDGSRLFLTGMIATEDAWADTLTLALDTATGVVLWEARYGTPGFESGYALGLAPDGSAVYVTAGASGTGDMDIVSLAYDAGTGQQRWLHRYDGPSHLRDHPAALAVSPDGGRVFVTGSSDNPRDANYVTLSYDAATGSLVWDVHYDGPWNVHDSTRDMTLSPDGATVFVTGTSVTGMATYYDIVTIAYSAATGSQRWLARYNGPGSDYDGGRTMAISPDGSRLYVSGTSAGASGAFGYVTLAYAAASGVQLWATRDDPGGLNVPAAMRISPSGSHVYVTGRTETGIASLDALTVAYETAAGTPVWRTLYNAPGNGVDQGLDLALAPDGKSLYMVGQAYSGSASGYDYATVAYDTTNGATKWAGTYSGGVGGYDEARAAAVSHDGARLFVTGVSALSEDGPWGLATIAYDASSMRLS